MILDLDLVAGSTGEAVRLVAPVALDAGFEEIVIAPIVVLGLQGRAVPLDDRLAVESAARGAQADHAPGAPVTGSRYASSACRSSYVRISPPLLERIPP